MSEIYCEWNDLDSATQHLLKSKELGEHTAFLQNRYRWHVAMARILEAQDNLDGALDRLAEAERLHMSDFSPNVRPIAAMKARIWITQGRLDDALDWAYEERLSADDDLIYVREFEHITLARLLLARYRSDRVDGWLHEASGLLERLLKAAEAGGSVGSVIEILVLQALIHQMQGDIQNALVPLRQALTLAEPENYVRIFVDEGLSMKHLLREAAAQKLMPNYTVRLLEAFAEPQGEIGNTLLSVTPVSQSLVEPLSQRELEILRLFNTDLSGPEIARELTVALSTIRTHTKSIYSKLNVNNRRAAIKRAAELNLI
jgi:LuxR family maltose regulon positive regulatory protein